MTAQGVTVTVVDTCPPNQGVSPIRAHQLNTSINKTILVWGLKLNMGYSETKVYSDREQGQGGGMTLGAGRVREFHR